ncbi:TPA: hypothetical protein ACGFBU_002467, partial [Clostridium perfringens]
MISIMGVLAATYAKSINRLTLANKLYFSFKYFTYVKLNNNIIKEVVIMAQVKQGRGYVYCIQYHIVWCVKYRRKV